MSVKTKESQMIRDFDTFNDIHKGGYQFTMIMIMVIIVTPLVVVIVMVTPVMTLLSAPTFVSAPLRRILDEPKAC